MASKYMTDDTYKIEKPTVLTEVDPSLDTVIEASAGTGKTYTIEHLVVDLILEHDYKLDEILVVTFNERAASEIQQRVRALLRSAISGTNALERPENNKPVWEVGESARRDLKKALFSFDRAPIYTIHGFCHRILTEHAFDHGRFLEQEHVDFDEIFDEVFGAVLREVYARDDTYAPYLQAWMNIHSHEPVESLKQCMADTVTDHAILRPEYRQTEFRRTLEPLLDGDVEATIDEIDAALGETDIHGNTVRSMTSKIGEVLQRANAVDEDRSAVAALQGLSKKKSGKTYYAYLAEKLSGRAFSNPALQSLQKLIDAGSTLEPAIRQLFGEPLKKRLKAEKKRQGVFCFDDMLSLVWETLSGDRGEELTRKLRARFNAALIDEFQDTDPIQWKIFRHLFVESRDHSCFIIGDPKQAIYDFRRGDVYTYLDAREEIAATNAPVALSTNYRSTPEVVRAQNRLFDQEASTPFFSGRIQYDRPVDCGHPNWQFDNPGSSSAPVQVFELEGEGVRAHARDATYASHYARQIADLLSEPTPTLATNDGDTTESIGPEDIFVLTRTRKEGDKIAQYLEKMRVPYAFYKRSGLWETKQARDVYQLLRAIESPHDWSSLQKAWMTPFFEIELANLPTLLSDYEASEHFRQLYRWHELAANNELEEMFTAILEESGLTQREVFFDRHERRLTNYLHLIEKLRQIAQREKFDLTRIATRLKGLIDGTITPEDQDDLQRLPRDDEAVQIMTLHKSKGLEADIVFLYGGFSAGRSGGSRLLHDENDNRIKYIGKPPSEIKSRFRQERRERNERLLYVGLTRARSQVYIPYYEKSASRRYRGGLYESLFPRLDELKAETDGFEDSDLFARRAIHPDDIATPEAESGAESGGGAPTDSQDLTWTPPDIELEFTSEEIDFDDHRRHRRQQIYSYSQLRRRSSMGEHLPSHDHLLEDDIRDEESPADRDDETLPAGRITGLFLHSILEDVDIDEIRDTGFDEWSQTEKTDELVEEAFDNYNIDPVFSDRAKQLAYTALTTPLAGPSDGALPPVSKVEELVREIEFTYPVPEGSHPMLGAVPETQLSVDEGFVKGFIDAVIRHDGKLFFADWKSNALDDYSFGALGDLVDDKYRIQTELYTLATLKMLGISTEDEYDNQFGGYFYLFVRGMGETEDSGIYFEKPSWTSLESMDAKLRREKIEEVYR